MPFVKVISVTSCELEYPCMEASKVTVTSSPHTFPIPTMHNSRKRTPRKEEFLSTFSFIQVYNTG